MSTSTVLILGATSSIAKATAERLAKQAFNLHLAGRDEEELRILANDLRIRYNVRVNSSVVDTENFSSHQAFVNKVLSTEHNEIYGLVVALGELGSQEIAVTDPAHTKKIIDSNFTGVVSIITCIAPHFVSNKQGFIVGISSVAGDRGRQSNYVYGSAKAGFTTFLAGLRNSLSKSNVQVITVKPGFVDTKMTFGKKGMFLVASPEQIADGIVKAIDKKKDVVYLPWFWTYIMMIIRSIPEPVFKRMKM